MSEKKTKFETFDALRFFAFFKVFLFHIPLLSFPVFTFLKNGGGIAVCFFFSLSGFLITYLILEEKKKTGKINLYYFFARRALRIWPLYYVMVLFAFLTPAILSLLSITPSFDGYEPDWIKSMLFLENYKMIFTNSFPNVSPLGVMWSLCVEEHFYLIWGIALYFIPLRKIYVLIACSIVAATVSRYVFYLNDWAFLDVFTNLDYFAYGAIPAALFSLSNRSTATYIVGISERIKWSVLCATVALILILPNIEFAYQPFFQPILLGAVFCLVLLLIVFQNDTFKIGSKNIFSYLGTFTYSLYLTHTIIINLFLKIFEKLDLVLSSPLIAFIFIVLCFSITVGASMLTYYLIEKPFLNLKNKFR